MLARVCSCSHRIVAGSPQVSRSRLRSLGVIAGLGMDRSLASFLQLPIFDRSFVSARCRLGFGRSEFWLALDEDEGADEQIVRLIEAAEGEQADRDEVLRHIELVASLA